MWCWAWCWCRIVPNRKTIFNFFLKCDECFKYLSCKTIVKTKNCDAMIKITLFNPKVRGLIIFSTSHFLPWVDAKENVVPRQVLATSFSWKTLIPNFHMRRELATSLVEMGSSSQKKHGLLKQINQISWGYMVARANGLKFFKETWFFKAIGTKFIGKTLFLGSLEQMGLSLFWKHAKFFRKTCFLGSLGHMGPSSSWNMPNSLE